MFEQHDEFAGFARKAPDPLALFSLVPDGASAQKVLLDPRNRCLVSRVPENDSVKFKYGLNIGPSIRNRSHSTLADIGREGDVAVDGNDISRSHCSFEIIHSSAAIVLRDRSPKDSVKILGPAAMPFEINRRPREVMIDPKTKTSISFGGINADRWKFDIVWHKLQLEGKDFDAPVLENPVHIRTALDDDETVRGTDP